MTQPKYAPITEQAEVRPAYHLEVPAPWRAHRPAELQASPGPRGRGTGVPGPDQGYAYLLARRFVDRLVLEHGEHGDDVIAGAVAVALVRASLFGRAPVAGDVEVALELFAYLGEAPSALVEFRREQFAGASHDYWERRELADLVPHELLKLSPVQVRADRRDWWAAPVVR